MTFYAKASVFETQKVRRSFKASLPKSKFQVHSIRDHGKYKSFLQNIFMNTKNKMLNCT